MACLAIIAVCTQLTAAEVLRFATLRRTTPEGPYAWFDESPTGFWSVAPQQCVALDHDGRLLFGYGGPIYRLESDGTISSLGTDRYVRGLAFARDGSLIIAEARIISRISPGGDYEVVAGGDDYGFADGPAEDARFREPDGIAIGPDGKIYVSDTGNHVIRVIAADGMVSTLAGAPGIPDSTDGLGAAARFNQPRGVAVDSSGNVYIADTGSSTIRRITADGQVTTIAGVAGEHAFADGIRGAARFHEPEGIALDGQGRLVVADTGNSSIRLINTDGSVTTIAGNNPAGGATQIGLNVRLNAPSALAIGLNREIYVGHGYGMLRGTPALHTSTGLPPAVTAVETYFAGVSTTIADSAGSFSYVWQGSMDGGRSWNDLLEGPHFSGVHTADLFLRNCPRSLSNTLVRVVIKEGTDERVSEACEVWVTPALDVAPFVGTMWAGSADGPGPQARFSSLRGIARGGGGDLYVTDGDKVRKISASGQVSTLAGSSVAGSDDGNGASAKFRGLLDIVVDGRGYLYVSDAGNSTVRKISPSGDVTTLAGSAGLKGTTDGTGNAARFMYPAGLVVTPSGDLYIADSEARTIRKITPEGVVTTFAGTPNVSGRVDGAAGEARFGRPTLLALDGNGNLYVCDGSSFVRKITSAGVVSTLAGSEGDSPGPWGTDGPGGTVRFQNLRGITVDSAGTLYVADYCAIRRILSDGMVSTWLGGPNRFGTKDGGTGDARLSLPGGIVVSAGGEAFFTDGSNVRRVSSSGIVSTFAGPGSAIADGVGDAARFGSPRSMAVGADGTLFVADASGHTIRQVTRAGVVSTLAGAPEISGFANGNGSNARFNSPKDIAVLPNGDLVVADSGNHVIRRVTRAGVVSTFSGTPGIGGKANGAAAVATFYSPTRVAANSSGDVFVLDQNWPYAVRKISALNGEVSLHAGGAWSETDGNGVEIGFIVSIVDMVLTDDGSLLLADTGGRVKRVTPDGRIFRMPYDIIGIPSGLAIDGVGNLYAVASTPNLAQRISPSGEVTFLAGVYYGLGEQEGLGSGIRFSYLESIAVSADGIVHVADGTGPIFSGFKALEIVRQPESSAAAEGAELTFSIGTAATGPVTYRWQHQAAGSQEFRDVAGVQGTTFTLPSVQAFHAGTYRVLASYDGYVIPSDEFEIDVAPSPRSNARVLNLSTRALDLQGDNVLIPGFVIEGTGTKRMLVRAVGPGMWDTFELEGYLPDPKLWLVNQKTGAEVASNDDWGTSANKADIIAVSKSVGAFPLLAESRDAVVLVDLPAGQYTVPTVGNNDGTGIAMVELYDADDDATTTRLANISNRGFVDVGHRIMIPGFVVSREGSRTFLIRAVGPGLRSTFNLQGVLEDPVLTVFRGAEAILANDDWDGTTGSTTTSAVAKQVGAFPLVAGSADAAFVVTLPPGHYTIQATGKDGTTGVALVEVYLVP